MPSDTRAYRSDDERALVSEPTQVGGPRLKSPTGMEFRVPEPSGDPYIGTIVSERYRVLSKLGEGGMGVVYLAEHILIEKKVALKILGEDFARKSDLVARFMQEAKAASRIGHENIVDISDFGQTASGSVFFAMEHLEGSDLATAIRNDGPMPFARVLPIVQQISRALAAAHGKGIIHRDMKPENIFIITRNGQPDFVKILDFGIAKMSALDEPNERLTRTGMIFGTPEYMSPEQARGDRPDHRVDIYALGCIIYEMLTGDVPFHAETFMGVLTKHMFETPEPLGAHVPVPSDVEAVVMRALSKNRDERYQSMRELADALTACSGTDVSIHWNSEVSGQAPAYTKQLSGVPGPDAQRTGSQAVPTSERSEEAPRRSRAPWYVGGGIIVAAGLFLALRPHALPPVVAPITPPIVVPQTVEPPLVPVIPAVHTVTVTMNPPGGELWDGEKLLGKLNGAFQLRHSTVSRSLTARKKGYRDHFFVVMPNSDVQLNADYELLPRKGGSSPVHKPTHDTQTTSQTSVRVDPPVQPPVKPKSERHDLMDPFENK
ncbi:MAG: serine/threonine-protein kinase [Polyangia bacterium]